MRRALQLAVSSGLASAAILQDASQLKDSYDFIIVGGASWALLILHSLTLKAGGPGGKIVDNNWLVLLGVAVMYSKSWLAERMVSR